ncbi:hypothetical protein HS088_TW13G00338 [Tripterygium wilfordii]|uniref:AB hydrolase-1 domain-containing protein n=1 Tax=Tripterygium wilfordii TaxID=458696 RepID=A0A7J7CTM8_TRIWF|nr:hypothetical protein HS088_TW13G00338 [Tripterygium wilfordii]
MATGTNRKVLFSFAAPFDLSPFESSLFLVIIVVCLVAEKTCGRTESEPGRLDLGYARIFGKILAVLLVGILAWAYRAVQPPPPKICGTPDGPTVTASRIKLRDGRHLAYKENGMSKDVAKHKIVYVHPFDACRHDAVIPTALSPGLVEELEVYVVFFDRPGYGESDPHPKRTVKSFALDIEELADQLGLGSKFYVIGYSMGGEMTWGCLKYIPHWLAGVTLLTPVINYWWPGFPANLSKEAYNQKLPQDQWTLRVAHYASWLIDWWMTQKLFPSSSVASHKIEILSAQDKEIAARISQQRIHVVFCYLLAFALVLVS